MKWKLSSKNGITIHDENENNNYFNFGKNNSM